MLLKITFVFTIFLLNGCSKIRSEFQKDADIIRLQHLKYYRQLLEEYHAIAGKYPFQLKKNIPVYVYIANDQQIEYTKACPQDPNIVFSFKMFVREVEKVLGREINEYYDPQDIPAGKPNFYIYMVRGDTYFFCVYVRQPYPFARKVADHHYAIDISNNPSLSNRALDPDLLFSSPQFNAELNKTVSNEAFFEKREDKYLHYTKSKLYEVFQSKLSPFSLSD